MNRWWGKMRSYVRVRVQRISGRDGLPYIYGSGESVDLGGMIESLWDSDVVDTNESDSQGGLK
jgi:hypothetical protein